MPYGGMSSAGSLGRTEEARSLVLLEVLLGQAFGRRLERKGGYILSPYRFLFGEW